MRRHILHHLRDWWVDEAEWIDDDEQPEQLLGNFVIVMWRRHILHHLRGWPIDDDEQPEQLLGDFVVVMCDDTYCII